MRCRGAWDLGYCLGALLFFVAFMYHLLFIVHPPRAMMPQSSECECTLAEPRPANSTTAEEETIIKNESKNTPATPQKLKTEVVVFVPTPVIGSNHQEDWEGRRRFVHRQFLRERWQPSEVALLFIYGSRAGVGLRDAVDVSAVVNYSSVVNVIVPCRDFGDEFDGIDETSGTTCKAYEAAKYIAQHYECRYVWRGADDSFLNLRYFFRSVMPQLPEQRLYFGKLRRADTVQPDLLLSRQPKLGRLLGLYQFSQYMSGMGFLLSYDVVVFMASWTIPPHLLWCEDLMVGMWLNAFQITFMDHPAFIDVINDGNVQRGVDYLVVHRMTPQLWDSIGDDGRLLL